MKLIWNRCRKYIYACNVAVDENENHESSIQKCTQCDKWPKREKKIDAEFKSLRKRRVFGPVVHTPNGTKPMAYKHVFIWKNRCDNEIMRCDEVVALGLSQRLIIDYKETHHHAVEASIFKFL